MKSWYTSVRNLNRLLQWVFGLVFSTPALPVFDFRRGESTFGPQAAVIFVNVNKVNLKKKRMTPFNEQLNRKKYLKAPCGTFQVMLLSYFYLLIYFLLWVFSKYSILNWVYIVLDNGGYAYDVRNIAITTGFASHHGNSSKTCGNFYHWFASQFAYILQQNLQGDVSLPVKILVKSEDEAL